MRFLVNKNVLIDTALCSIVVVFFCVSEHLLLDKVLNCIITSSQIIHPKYNTTTKAKCPEVKESISECCLLVGCSFLPIIFFKTSHLIGEDE